MFSHDSAVVFTWVISDCSYKSCAAINTAKTALSLRGKILFSIVDMQGNGVFIKLYLARARVPAYGFC